MSFTNKLKQRLDEVKEQAERKIIELKLEADARDARLAICEGCEHLFKPTSTCTKCGCFVHAKTWLRNEKCPLGKW